MTIGAHILGSNALLDRVALGRYCMTLRSMTMGPVGAYGPNVTCK